MTDRIVTGIVAKLYGDDSPTPMTMKVYAIQSWDPDDGGYYSLKGATVYTSKSRAERIAGTWFTEVVEMTVDFEED